MAFDSYIEFKKAVETIGFDIILGVRDTITENTAYLSLFSSKKVGSDGFEWAVGYTYSIVVSVEDADSDKVKELSQILDDITFTKYSDASHLYIFSGHIYLPVSEKGEAWE